MPKNKADAAKNKTDVAKNKTDAAKNKTDAPKNKTDATKNKTDAADDLTKHKIKHKNHHICYYSRNKKVRCKNYLQLCMVFIKQKHTSIPLCVVRNFINTQFFFLHTDFL